MSEMLRAALDYASSGCRVFPVHGIVNGRCTCGRVECPSPGKHPLVKRGVHDATTDERVIREWWRRWRAANIGIATGLVSGIVVVDLDLPKALASIDVVIHKLPSTLVGLTGGGGLHLLYRRAAQRPLRNHTSQSGGRPPTTPLRNHTGSLPGIAGELPGVDLRADGGHIVAPPSLHILGGRYSWLDSARNIAQAPEWLKEPPRRVVAIAPAKVSFDGDGTRIGLKVLGKQLTILTSAKEGQRNHTLNRCAFVVARYVAAGHLLEICARAELTRVALSIGLSDWETERTIDSAFSAIEVRAW